MKEMEVVYEKGVFKPLENVELKEGVKRKVRIEEEEEGFEDFERFFGIFKGKEIHIDEERDEIVEGEGKNKEEMAREIEAVYENGVLKPLEQLDLREGERVKVVVKRERGVITSEDIQEIARIVEKLPKVKVEKEELDEIYYEGKMFD